MAAMRRAVQQEQTTELLPNMRTAYLITNSTQREIKMNTVIAHTISDKYNDDNKNISEKELRWVVNYLNNILLDNMHTPTIDLLTHVRGAAANLQIKISLNQINHLLCKILELSA
ncbi:hypothetical protein [Nitrospira sp. BLG_2]|uniref:hypothetical protein n=1 Tax=Nitrospira sp. BLG_2 TaxID=3397507 RepID=UPI003B9CB460